MKVRRVLALVMAVLMVIGLMPVVAAGDGATDPVTSVSKDNGFVHVNKSVNEAGNELTLEAYLTNEVTQTVSTKLLDIVLVLDQSGSMADLFGNVTRQAAMKNAVNAFIEEVAAKNAGHRMAIVTFDSDAQRLVEWTTVDGSGKTKLTAAINGLPITPEGATNVGEGMQEAEKLMNSATDTDTDRQKVVIVFTDGVPTTTNEFSTDVANTAITAAKNMKDSGVTIYTVGIFNGANPDELYGKDKIGFWGHNDGECTGNKGDYWQYRKGLFSGGDIQAADIAAGNRFLNYLSNNYDASGIGISSRGYDGLFVDYRRFDITADTAPGENKGYYLTANNASGLNAVFQQIVEKISTLNIVADKNTILSDTLSEYFTLNVPEGKTDRDAIKVEKVICTGVDDKGKYTWGEPEVLNNAGVTIDGKTIKVTGFDYTANAVTKTEVETDTGTGTAYFGYKLVVTIPIKQDNRTTVTETDYYPTNDIIDNRAGLSNYTDKYGKSLDPTLLDKSPMVMIEVSDENYTVNFKINDEDKDKGDIIDYTLAAEGQNQSEFTSITKIKGTNISLGLNEKDVDVKAAEGYTFIGWYDGETLVTAAEIGENFADKTLVARFEQNPVDENYTVNFKINDEDKDKGDIIDYTLAAEGQNQSEFTSITKIKGTKILLGPSKKDVDVQAAKGYTFIGWSVDEIPVTATEIDESFAGKTLVAMFEQDQTPIPTRLRLTIITPSATKEYDDTPLTNKNSLDISADIIFSDDSEKPVDTKNIQVIPTANDANVGYDFKVIFYNQFYLGINITGERTQVGESANTYEIVAYNQMDSDTESDYSDDAIFVINCLVNYFMEKVQLVDINSNLGKLTVTAKDDPIDPPFIVIFPTLEISNKVIAPKNFEKTSFEYDIINVKTGDVEKSVTLKADSSVRVMVTGGTEYMVVPKNLEVPGYIVTTTSTPDSATVTSDKIGNVSVDFTHIYVVGLNTEDHYAYIRGYEDGTIRPEGNITRAEVATIFYRLLSSEALAAFKTTENTFTDVDSDAWYNLSVSTLAKAGVISGYPDGSFNPNGKITRAELVSIATRFFTTIEVGDSKFSDIAGHWAAKAIDEAYIKGIIKGYSDGTFRPDQAVTRAEAMKIVNGILGRPIDTCVLIEGIKLWPDVASDAWYYYVVAEATNAHRYELTTPEKWTAIIINEIEY